MYIPEEYTLRHRPPRPIIFKHITLLDPVSLLLLLKEVCNTGLREINLVSQ